jgi:hypothetical protein
MLAIPVNGDQNVDKRSHPHLRIKRMLRVVELLMTTSKKRVMLPGTTPYSPQMDSAVITEQVMNVGVGVCR